MSDYILYVSQQGNFQSRSMLIPMLEFLKVRNEDYNLLKRSSIKNHKFTLDNEEYIVDNLILNNYENVNENSYTQTDSEYRILCNHLISYADGMDDDWYFKMKDKAWYDLAITNLCRGFNHIYNYKMCKEITEYKDKQINIVDSFLVLESRHGKYNTNY